MNEKHPRKCYGIAWLCLCMACLVNYSWRHLCKHLVSNMNNFIALVTHYVKWARTYNRIMPPSLTHHCALCCNRFLSYRHFPIRIIYIVAIHIYICHVALLILFLTTTFSYRKDFLCRDAITGTSHEKCVNDYEEISFLNLNY